MVSIRVWLEEHRIITCRMRRLLSIEDIRDAIAKGRGPSTPGEFLTRLTERLVARIGEFSAGIQDSIDELEDEVLATESRALRTRLATTRRKVIELRRYLSPQRDALNRLVAERPAQLSELNNLQLREYADLLTRYVEDLDSARDRAAVTNEELANRLTEQLNNRLYLLAVVATIFLPLGFLTGLLGINVGGIPGAENTFGFTQRIQQTGDELRCTRAGMNHHQSIVVVDIQHQIFQRAGRGWHTQFGWQTVNHLHFGVARAHRTKLSQHTRNF